MSRTRRYEWVPLPPPPVQLTPAEIEYIDAIARDIWGASSTQHGAGLAKLVKSGGRDE